MFDSVVIVDMNHVLVAGITKELVPFIRIKVGEVFRLGCDSCKPIVSNNVELGCNGACNRAVDQRYRAGMIR